MRLSEFMKSRGLDDEEMASLIREAGASCDRTTISRLRRGKVWLSKDLALAFRKATDNRVTADDFAVVPESDEARA
jgi:transcriptional regulator with XRE-family HTH domain